MATSFMENLRRPKNLERWAPTGEINPGESDPYNWGKDLIERDFRDSQMDELPGRRRGNISRMGGELANPNFNRAGFDPAKVYQNTVYNQGPEMATKQFNLQKDKMAAAEKENEKQRAVDMLAANDNFIDKRRGTELKQQQAETQNWAARNLKPGEMGDRDKLELQHKNASMLNDADNKRFMDVANLNNAAEQQRQIEKSINDWVNTNSKNRVDTENNQRSTQATRDAADRRATAMENAARIRTPGTTTTISVDPEYPDIPTSGPVKSPVIRELNQLADPNYRPTVPIETGKSSANPNIPMNPDANLNPNRLAGGFASAALSGTPGSSGLRGNARIDQNATATPWAKNSSNSSPTAGGGGQIMRKTQRSARTGATRTLISRDGGNTWQPE